MQLKHVALAGAMALGLTSSVARAASLTLTPSYIDFGEVQSGETSQSVNVTLNYTREYSVSQIFTDVSDSVFTRTSSNSCVMNAVSCSFGLAFEAIAGFEGDIFDMLFVSVFEFTDDFTSFQSSFATVNVHAYVSASTPSPVPLPASAPMFGAALLGLAGLGYAAKRKKAVAAA